MNSLAHETFMMGSELPKSDQPWNEAEKAVEKDWLRNSPLMAKCKNKRITLKWVRVENLLARARMGWHLFYEVDIEQHIRHRITLSSNTEQLILMAKRK